MVEQPGSLASPSDSLHGLSAAEAAARLRAEGFNEPAPPAKRTPLRIALEIVREPMFELLLLAAGTYSILGDRGEALMLSGSALLMIAITTVQESKTERVLESLRELTSPRALVIRDGASRRIPGREVVRGDIIVLGEGDRVPADALLLSSHDLQVDESLLTGESVPVSKAAGAPAAPWPRPGGEALPVVFSGTMVVRGQGIAEVRAVGFASEVGKIGQSLGRIEEEPSPLHHQVRGLVRLLAGVGFGLGAVMMTLYGLLRGPWFSGLLAAIAIAMAIMPEEFPLVLTIFLVMGTWRISKASVLTRRAAAIESLGAATVLCTDKTGTLTLNQMSVANLWSGGQGLDLPIQPPARLAPALRALLEVAILASESAPADPMEKAIQVAGQQYLGSGAFHPDWGMAHEYALSSKLFVMSHVWQPPGQSDYVVAAKGAPEAVAGLAQVTGAALEELRAAADRMASRGMRVLGVARANFDGPRFPESQSEFAFEFLGLVALADPLRPGVPGVIRECRAAGIKVVMVTGDYPATAGAIARQAGLDHAGIVAGAEVAALSDAELRERVRTSAIFARITPEQKLRIVNAFKANGEIVAMTGDGVNDAPSLRAAHIGIAMGGRGTDVAREASAIVLLDDEPTSIVMAVRLGRRIYDNLSKAMSFLLAVHVPIAGLALLPLFAGLPLILAPVHIAFLQLCIDPISSIVFESEVEEDDVMQRKPRDSRQPLFSPALVGWSLFQGGWVFCLVAATFLLALRRGLPESEARALTFTSLVSANFALVLVNRSFSSSPLAALARPNAALWVVSAVMAALLGLSLVLPQLREIFGFAPLHAHDVAIVLGACILTLAVLEPAKRLRRRFAGKRDRSRPGKPGARSG